MRRQIKEIISELEVTVIYSSELEKSAHYIAAINTIVISSRLSEYAQKKMLLHELGHVSKHKNNYILYKRSFALHAKMEAEADEYMTKFLIKDYLSNENMTLDQVNYIHFIESNELDIDKSYLIKEWFSDLIREELLA